jgi:MoaA/NifB/PqqE/SkfB family radical SAM enzyme
VYLSGLCTTGINFTGGEVLGNRDDLFEILTYTQSLGVPYRLNTNSWWSRKDSIKICGESFSPLELVRHLKSIGLKQFAFSYDDRMVSADMFNDLVESIKICEIANMEYQIIFTGVKPEKIPIILRDLQKPIEHYLYRMMPVSNEMVDIGGCTSSNVEYEWQSNKAPCADKGFYHPAFLHISPDGKVRTCMYAVGSANVGDISERSLADLINEFPNRNFNDAFSNQQRKAKAFEELVMPFLSLYRPLVHECTRNAVLTRAIEMYSNHPERNPTDIHVGIARDLNLTL